VHWIRQWSVEWSTKLLTVSYYIFLASTPVGWLVPAWLLRPWLWPEETTRQQARKLQWLPRPIDSLTPYREHVVMWWPWWGEWSPSDALSPHCYCQSLREVIALASKPINDQCLPRSRHAGLQSGMFGCSAGFCPSLAIYFISTL